MLRDNDRWIADLRTTGHERERALGDLRDVLLRNLRRTLDRRHADGGLAEDVAQEALVRILDRMDQFAGRSRFVTWATAIAIRIALAELRRSRWKDVSLDEVMADADFIPQQAIDPEAPPDVQAERRALIAAVERIIADDLTDRQRTALLAELKGMPQAEIARHLGSNRNAVYKLTHDARKKLKQALQAAGYTAADVVVAAR